MKHKRKYIHKSSNQYRIIRKYSCYLNVNYEKVKKKLLKKNNKSICRSHTCVNDKKRRK